VALEFEALVRPGAGTFELVSIGTSASGLTAATVVSDGVTGAGPANTLELVTTNVANDLTGTGACGFPSSFCADVTIRSFYPGALSDVHVEITRLTPAAGHTGLNSVPPAFGLSNALGLFAYGSINGGGGTATQTWVFGDDGTDYRVAGRVMADLCTNGVRDGDEEDVDCGGAACTACSSCANGILDGDETEIDCGGASCEACPVRVRFPLVGTQVAPASGSGARGECTAELSGARTSVDLTCTHDVTGATTIELRSGARGTNGTLISALGSAISPIDVTAPLTTAEADALLAGDVYVTVASMARPAGDVRGQVATVQPFKLVPRQATPAVSSAANGTCTAYLSPGQTSLGLACTHSLATPTSARIETAAPGVAGVTTFELGQGTSPIDTTITVGSAEASSYLAGNLALVLRSAAFPSGELRGQLAQAIESAGNGEQEVPSVASAAALACTSYLSPSGTSLALGCTHSVAGATAAHVHAGAPGSTGGVVFDLGSGTSPIATTLTLSDAERQTLLAGDYYVNVHSGAFPGGEVRAQLGMNLAIDANGYQHIPENATARSARCGVHVNPGETTMRFRCTHDIGDATTAHVHRCSGACSGVIWSPNFPNPLSPFTASVNLTVTDVADLVAGNFYLHIHSTTFGGAGEIRGQIAETFDFALEASQVVPPSGSAATGRCLLFMGFGENVATATRCIHDAASPTSIQLRRGPVGVGGQFAQTLSNTGVSPMSSTTQFSQPLAVDVRAGGTYLTVQTAAFPNGELRGQIVP
jgi:hypothetical protein